MPLSPQHRWVTFLLLIAVLALGIGAGVIVAHDGHTDLSPTEERFISACLTIVTIVGGFIALDIRGRKREESLKQETKAVAEVVAEKTISAAKKTRDDIRHDMRSELQPVALRLGEVRGAQQAHDEGPYPSSPQQLREFIRDVVAESGAQYCKQTIEELQLRGIIPRTPKP